MFRTVNVKDSWAIDKMAYNHTRRELRIHFVSTDTTWAFYEVPIDVFVDLYTAVSIGEMFNHHVRNVYRAERIDKIEDP